MLFCQLQCINTILDLSHKAIVDWRRNTFLVTQDHDRYQTVKYLSAGSYGFVVLARDHTKHETDEGYQVLLSLSCSKHLRCWFNFLKLFCPSWHGSSPVLSRRWPSSSSRGSR